MKTMLLSNQQIIQTLQSSLLMIYDEILITDVKGEVLHRSGELENFWSPTTLTFTGRTITEFEEFSFFGDPIFQLLNREVQSLQLKAWNGNTLLITVFPTVDDRNDGFMVWGFKTISSIIEGSQEVEIIESDPNEIPSLVAQSPNMKNVLETIKMVSQVPTTVLLLGESGVGKEIIAKHIHQLGHRRSKPFIAVNCGAIPKNLLESELFGYVSGAFSGANPNGAPGKFQLADGGIIFLDEIAELPLSSQVKLLRTLQEREVTPLGSSKSIHVDVQIVTATNKSLEVMVKEGRFREDLYYRLNVVPIEIPSLKERIEEIPSFIYHFSEKYNRLI